MAKKTGKRMPLAEVQLEIDGDREYEDMQDGYSAYLEDEADMLQALHAQWDNQWIQDQEEKERERRYQEEMLDYDPYHDPLYD